MVGRKHIIFWTRLWRENRLMLLSSLLILSLPSTAFSSYRMSQTVSCGEGSTKCSSSDPLKGLKQANREFKSVFQVNRGSATDKATVKNSSKKTGFVENLIDTSEEVLGRFSRSISSGRNKRPSIFSDGIIFLTSWFSNHYFTLSSSASQCLSSTQKTWNAMRFRGRGPLSARNPSSANQTSEGFAHIFQTGASGLQLVENIDLQSYSREVVNASYSRSESGCEGNSESFDAVGSAPSELGDLSIIYGNNSFAATGEGTNPNMVFAMEQASQNDAFFQGLTSGVFSGFFTAVSSATTAPIQTATFTPTGNGKTFNIDRLTDFSDSSTASAWGVLTLNQLNSPAPGFHQGILTKDGQQGQALCMAGLLDDQNTLVCSAQLPSNPSVPVYLFATMTPKASVKMTAPELVGMPGQEVCGDIVLEGATQSTTAQLTPSSYYWGSGAFSGQNGQCAGSSATGVAQVGALETCNVRICTLIAGASLDFNISFQEDSQTTAQEFATVSFQEPPAPVITASSDIASGTVPLFVNFSALEVSGNITSWLVDFGDGYQSTYYNGSNSYLFYTPGEFTVSVKGVNSYGRESNIVFIPISVLPVYGCTSPGAYNFNPMASSDDGSCQYYVYGCMDSMACNYDTSANMDSGTCDYSCRYGCNNASACNYDPNAYYDNGTCDYSCFYVYGCMDSTACNYDASANMDNGTCEYMSCWYVYGCTNSSAMNYNPSANMDDGTCQIYGCTNFMASNYNSSANYDDGSCQYAGCSDSVAVNYNPSASSDDGSCQYSNGGMCWTSAMCTSGSCIGGTCNAGGSNGTACTQNYECSSNACNNGYCDGGNLAGCTSHAYMNGRFYCFVANDIGFAQARYSAPYIPQFPQGGHLVTITSQQEYDLVVSMISPHGRNVWLGMTDLAQEGDWQTITGEPLNGWSMWGPGEPNNMTWTGDTSGEHFAQLGNLWGGWPYLINDAPASSWMLNSAVYEYDEYTDQTPNPNCSVDYDGDGVCAGVDSDDSNSRVSTAPQLISSSITNAGSMLQLTVNGNNLGNMSYMVVRPSWAQWYIDYYGWSWYTYYDSYIYPYNCSTLTDTQATCTFYPYGGGNESVITFVNNFGTQSNRLTFYSPSPTISNVIVKPNAGLIQLEGQYFNIDPFYNIQIGDYWQYYYINNYECSTVSDTLIICPYNQSRNYYNNYYGYLNSYWNYYYFTFNIEGCTDPAAGNYTPGANISDGSCDYTPVLVSHWKFDGDFNDYGTLGNHGWPNGVALSAAGGGAAQFNSSAAYGGSSLSTGPGYNNFTSGATTVSFWYKADTVANNPIFIDFKMGGGDTFIHLGPGSSAGTHRVFWAPRGWGYTVGSQEYSVNGWTQVTIVYNGNGMWNYGGSNVSFYINGTPVSATSWDCCNGGYTSSNQLGRDSYSAMWGDNSRAYSGLLDDVRVYRGNLSSWDISNLYNERASLYFSGVLNGACYLNGTIVSYLSNGTGYCSGNEKYYMNDEPTTLDANGSGVHGGLRYVAGSLANGVHGGLTTPGSNTALFMNMDDFSDTSSYAHSMTLNGSPYTSSGKGVFNGGNSLTINSPGAELQFTGPFTIEVQAVINNPSQRQFFVNSAVPWGGHNYGFGLEQYPDGRPISGISFYWGYWGWYGFWLHTSYVPPAGESHHYAITRDASNTWRIFIDGVQTSYQVWQENYSFDPGMPLYGSSEKVLGYMVNGEIDHLIVTNGEALYTSNFTPNNSSIACYANGVDTGTVSAQGTGPCEGVYYVAGSATTLPLNGTGTFNGKEYVNGVALSGLFSDTCYNDGVVVNVLVNGTGYCAGNLTFYFMGTAQTNFDGMGSGTTADGQVFIAGTPANTVVNGVCYNNGFATSDLINGSGKCLSNGQWYIDGIYASRLDNLGNGTWGFNLAATPGKETSSPPGFIDSAVADETAAPGNYVWIAPRWGTAQKLNIMTGTVVSNLSIPGGVELVKSGDYVWALHVGGSGAHRVHRSTDEITSFYESHFTQGYGAAASDGYLWLSDPNSPILKKVHGETGALIATADFSSVLSGSIRSIRADSLKIAIVAGSKMSFVDKTNLSIVRTIELPNDGGFTANEAWIMAEGGGAWFLSGGGGYKTIYRYDYHNNTGSYVNITIASIEGCAVNSTGFWVPSTWGSTMYHVKFDGTVDRTIELSSYGIYSYPKTRLAVGETVWVSTYQPQLHLLDFPEITYSNGQPVQ